jgi:hypothetical protein
MKFALVVALLVGWFAWITPYRYDFNGFGESRLPMRTHRFTGETQILVDEGWLSMPQFQKWDRERDRSEGLYWKGLYKEVVVGVKVGAYTVEHPPTMPKQ